MKGKSDGKAKQKQSEEVNFGFGPLSFGGILKGFGDLVALAGEIAEKGEAIHKQGEFKSKMPNGKEVHGMYGFSISTLEGKPVVKTFGNIRRTPKGPVVEDVREPYVDIFDEKQHVKVIAELPGVGEDQIHLDLAGDMLTISASGKTSHKYYKEVLLPAKGKEGGMAHTFRNGVLEVLIEKQAK